MNKFPIFQKKVNILFLIFSIFAVTFELQAQESRLESSQQPFLGLSTTLINSRPNNPTKRDLSQLALELSTNRPQWFVQGQANLLYSYFWPSANSSVVDEKTSFIEEISLGVTKEVSSLDYKYETSLLLGVPSNKMDQKAGYLTSVNWENKVSYLLNQFTLFARLTPTFYSYSKETIDAEGTEYNKKMGVLVGGGVSIKFLKNFSWTNSADFFEYQNYANNSYQIYSLVSSLTFAVSNKLKASLAVASKDRVVSNRNVFEDNNTNTKLILNWVL